MGGRRWWGENGVYVTLLLALTVKFAVCGDGAFAVLVLPMSAVYSLHAALRFVGNRSAKSLWWVRNSVSWMAWWIVNLLCTMPVTVLVGTFLFSALNGDHVGGCYLVWMSFFVALPPSLVSVKHVSADYHAARHKYGSITKAGRMLRFEEQRFAAKVGIP